MKTSTFGCSLLCRHGSRSNGGRRMRSSNGSRVGRISRRDYGRMREERCWKTRLSNSCSQGGEREGRQRRRDSDGAGGVEKRSGRRTGRHALRDNDNPVATCVVSAAPLKGVAVGRDARVEVRVRENVVAHPRIPGMRLDVFVDRPPELGAARWEVGEALTRREWPGNVAKGLATVRCFVLFGVLVALVRLSATRRPDTTKWAV